MGHLFGEQLSSRGFAIDWSMWRDKAGMCETVHWQHMKVGLPAALGKEDSIKRLATRLLRSVCDGLVFIRMLTGGYDIIQARDLRYLAALFGWLAARVTGARFIFWLSYPFPEHYLEWAQSSRGIRRWIRAAQGRLSFWFVYKWLMHRADHVFVQSDQMQRDVSGYGVPFEKMTVVPMGVPPKLLAWRDNKSVPTVPGRVVYVGTMARVRRLETLIQAFALVAAHVPNSEFVMVGEGDSPNERAALEQEAKRLGIQDRVLFTGFIPMEDAWRYAASAAVCVSPFYPTFVLNSTSPTKLNEYLALGRPTVVNDHPEQSRTISETGAGVCVDWSAESFAKGILRMLADPETAEHMAAAGPDWVLRNRTYDRIADKVAEKYRALLAG